MHSVLRSLTPRLARGMFPLLASALAALAFAAPVPPASTERPVAAGSLDFDRTFNARGEPAQLYFQAHYQVNGKDHETELWRDGEHQLKRRTDARLETYVFKPDGSDEWRMVVLDLAHKIRTQIDRTNLLRIGHFTDWFSMAHALARPVGGYTLRALPTTAQMPVPVSRCRWYGLTRDGVESRICWSSALHLPLLITDSANQVAWHITKVDRTPLGASHFAISDAGFVHNDANEEIKGD